MKRFIFSILLLMLLFIQNVFAQQFYIYSPGDGGTIFINQGETATINLRFDIQYNFQHFYCWILTTESGADTNRNIQSRSFPTMHRGPGTYHWKLRLYVNVMDAIYQLDSTSVTFTVQAGVSTQLTAKNTMGGGVIRIDGTQRDHGYSFTKISGDVAAFEAIDQTYEGIYRVWNTSGNQISNWRQKTTVQTSLSAIQGATQRNYTRTISSSDNGMEIYADLKKRFDFSRTEQSEFDGTSSAGVVTQIVEGNTGQITAPATKTLNGRAYNFAGWTDGDTTNPRTISSPTTNATYTALYKYPSHTDYYYTRYFNNQRKVTRTNEGSTLYQVYESMNKVWLEMSTNSGASWSILNRGMPLNTGNAKCASMCTYGGAIGIVYQQQAGTGYDIMLRFFFPNTNTYNTLGYGPFVVSEESTESYSTHACPVIGWVYGGKLLIAYEKKWDGGYGDAPGIRYYYGESNGTDICWHASGIIDSTDANSRTPAIDCMQTYPGFNPAFHLLWWQTTGPASCSVHYQKIQWNTNNVLSFSSPQNLSSDLEYPGSANENLIAYMSDSPEFIWKSENYDYEDGDVYTTYSTIVLKNSNMHWEFGDDAVMPSIAKNFEEDFYAFSWQNGNSTYQFATSDDFTINTIGNYGYAAQLCPGGSLYNMYLLGLGDDAPSMYHFTNSNSLGSYYYKAPATGSYVGRYADINIKGTTFRLGLSDILVDNKSINFVPIPKDDTIASLEKMNSILESQPFELSNNSTFDYSVVYKFADSLKAKTALGDNGYLNFKVELVDAATDKVLGTYDTLTYSKNQVRKRSLKAYEVSAEGLGNRTVKLRMVINSNADIKSIEAVQKYSTTSAMSKRSKKSIAYNGSAKVAEYAISQNYPNPFNPTTMINYQIPKNGMVSIKVYNINGTEVANLVNEVKESGRYSVEFNARNLASGVYFYRIISGDFVQTKKMAVLK